MGVQPIPGMELEPEMVLEAGLELSLNLKMGAVPTTNYITYKTNTPTTNSPHENVHLTHDEQLDKKVLLKFLVNSYGYLYLSYFQ